MSNGKVGKTQQSGAVPQVPPDSTPAKPASTPQSQQTASTPLSDQAKAQQKGMHNFEGDIKKAELEQKTDVKAMTEKAVSSKLDGAAGISKEEYDAIKKSWHDNPQKSESMKWLEQKHPSLHAAIVSDLDYSGYVGTAVGSLNLTTAGSDLKDAATSRNMRLNKLPDVSEYNANGLPKSQAPGDPVPGAEAGEKWKEYKTGNNKTYIKDGSELEKISDADANKSREAQKNYCAKMAGIIGTDIPNPPSVNASRNYFQQLANRGATQEQIKAEYQEYLKTFYRHPGGVTWDPKLDPKNLDKNFGQQPLAKDGKRLIDCEGYSALTENILGGIKKDDKPMFDIMHGSGPGHVITGVFPHGGDPRKGFVVSNDQVDNVKWNSMHDKDYNASPNSDTRQRFVVRTYWSSNYGGSTNQYGSDYTKMAPPPDKLKKH